MRRSFMVKDVVMEGDVGRMGTETDEKVIKQTIQFGRWKKTQTKYSAG